MKRTLIGRQRFQTNICLSFTKETSEFVKVLVTLPAKLNHSLKSLGGVNNLCRGVQDIRI